MDTILWHMIYGCRAESWYGDRVIGKGKGKGFNIHVDVCGRFYGAFRLRDESWGELR